MKYLVAEHTKNLINKMSEIVFNYASEFFSRLREVYHEDRSVTVDVASFGMYLGISNEVDWHRKKYPVDARYFIEEIDRVKLRMVIGVPEVLTCTPTCDDCIDKYNKRLENFAYTQQALHLPITFVKNSHLKMYRIGDRYFAGGINLTNSTYVDASFEILDTRYQVAMQEKFNMLWKCQTRDISIFSALYYADR